MTYDLVDIKEKCQKAAMQSYNTEEVISHLFDNYSYQDTNHNSLIQAVFQYLTTIGYTEMMEQIVNKFLSIKLGYFLQGPTLSMNVAEADCSSIIGDVASYIEVTGEINTVLDWAVKQGHLKTVQYLINHIDNSKERYLKLIDNAWLLAVHYQKIDILKFIVPLVPVDRVTSKRGDSAVREAMSATSKDIGIIMISVSYSLGLGLAPDSIHNTPDFLAKLILTRNSLSDIILSDTNACVVQYLLSQVPAAEKYSYWCRFIHLVLLIDANISEQHTKRFTVLLENMPQSSKLFLMILKIILTLDPKYTQINEKILALILQKMDKEKSKRGMANTAFKMKFLNPRQAMSFLRRALPRGNIDLFKRIMAYCNNVSDEDRVHLLGYITGKCDLFNEAEQQEIFKELFNKPGDIFDVECNKDENPLIIAMRFEKNWLVRELIRAERFKKIVNEAVTSMVLSLDIARLKFLYENGFNESPGKNSNTLLVTAIHDLLYNRKYNYKRVRNVNGFTNKPFDFEEWRCDNKKNFNLIHFILNNSTTNINARGSMTFSGRNFKNTPEMISVWEYLFYLFKEKHGPQRKIMYICSILLRNNKLDIGFNSNCKALSGHSSTSILLRFYVPDSNYSKKFPLLIASREERIELLKMLSSRNDTLLFNSYVQIISLINFSHYIGSETVMSLNFNFIFNFANIILSLKNKLDPKLSDSGVVFLEKYIVALQESITEIQTGVNLGDNNDGNKKNHNNIKFLLSCLDEIASQTNDFYKMKNQYALENPREQIYKSSSEHHISFLKNLGVIWRLVLRNEVFKALSKQETITAVGNGDVNDRNLIVSFACKFFPTSMVYQLLVRSYGIFTIGKQLDLFENFFYFKMIDWKIITGLNKEIIHYWHLIKMENGESYVDTAVLPIVPLELWRYLVCFLSYDEIKKMNEQYSSLSKFSILASSSSKAAISNRSFSAGVSAITTTTTTITTTAATSTCDVSSVENVAQNDLHKKRRIDSQRKLDPYPYMMGAPFGNDSAVKYNDGASIGTHGHF